MSFLLLLSLIFNIQSSQACKKNNPNFYLKQSLTNNARYSNIMADQNVAKFINSQDCECDPKKGLNFSLPSFIKKDPKKESRKQFFKYQVKFSSADLEFYDEHGHKRNISLGFTSDNRMTAVGGLNFLMDIKKVEDKVGCKNILTPKEKKAIRDCSSRVKLALKEQDGNADAVLKSCEIKVSKVRKSQNLMRKKLTAKCKKNSREVKSFYQLQQEMIAKSKFDISGKQTNDSNSDEKPQRLGISVSLKSLGEGNFSLNDSNLIISYQNEVGVKESGAIFLDTDANLVSVDNNYYLSFNNRVTQKFNGQVNTRTTISGGTGNEKALFTASATANKKGDERTRLSATLTAGYEGKLPNLKLPGLNKGPSEITFNGFITATDDNQLNYGASGRNKDTGTVYSLKRKLSDVEGGGDESVYASVQKPLNFGGRGISNLALSTVGKHTKDQFGNKDFQVYVVISGVTF